MSALRFTAVAVLLAAALAGCGSAPKPRAGTPAAQGQTVGHARVDDPRTLHVECLKQAHLPVTEVGQTGVQVGPLPNGPTIVFEPTPGAAQESQLSGKAQGAEVIGSALLYPNK